MRRDTNSNQSSLRGISTRILNSVIFLAGIAVYGAETTAKSVFQNGDLNAIQKMNPVRVKQLQKNNNVAVDDIMPLSWFFNGKNSKLEMCQNPDNPKDYYAKLTGGVLCQIYYGKAKNYRITFRAKGPGKMRFSAYRYIADENRKIKKYIGTKILVSGLTLGEEWKHYSYVLRKEFDDEVFAPAFVHRTGEICIDDVVITDEAK